MRITGGKYKGFALASPKNNHIRPTADRVRESLFNILSHHPALDLEDAVVLDLFCGSGTLGLEAISRGASSCIFVDNSNTSLQLCRQNAAKLKLTDSVRFLKHNVTQRWPENFTPESKVSLVFADPPYGLDLAVPAITRLVNADLLAENTLLVIEMSAKQPESEDIPHFKIIDQRKYGDTILRLYQPSVNSL